MDNQKETKLEYLRMEYEQTVQTLRNWDSLFFNTFVSIVVAGVIGGAMAWQKSGNPQQLKAILLVVPSTLFFVCLLYFLYNRLIARRKFEVLNTIEDKLSLIGAYKVHNSQIKRMLNLFLLPLFSIVYIVYLALVLIYF